MKFFIVKLNVKCLCNFTHKYKCNSTRICGSVRLYHPLAPLGSLPSHNCNLAILLQYTTPDVEKSLR